MSFMLSGCGGSSFAPDFAPQRAFALPMTAQINGNDYAAVLTCDPGGSLLLNFTGPPELSCFSVRTADGGYVMDAGGLEDRMEASELYGDAPLRLLLDTVKTAVFTNHGAFVRDRENGVYTADLTVNGADVRVVFDAEGYLLSLTAPGLTAGFTRSAGKTEG